MSGMLVTVSTVMPGSVPHHSASSLSSSAVVPGGLSIARLMGPCRNFPVAPRGLRADPTRPRPPDGPALHESQLCGCLEHSRDIPHFWTEQRT